MRKIILLFLFFNVLFFSSCTKAEEKMPLLQEMNEILVNTDYTCWQVSIDHMKDYLQEKNLNRTYEVDDAVDMTSLKIYRLRKGNAKKLKNHFLENTLPGYLSYGAKEDLLFIGLPQAVSKELQDIIGIQLEEGTYSKEDIIPFTSNGIGIDEKIFEKEIDHQYCQTYKDYEEIKKKIILEEKTTSKVLDDITEKTFEESNLLFVQLPLFLDAYPQFVRGSAIDLVRKNNCIEVILYCAYNDLDVPASFNYNLFLITFDKKETTSKFKLSIFGRYNGLKNYLKEL